MQCIIAQRWHNWKSFDIILGMKIRERVMISELTTMRIGGPARYVVEIEKIEDLHKAYGFAKEQNLPVWIMGEGANTIGHDEGFDGVIIINKLQGVEIVTEDENSMTLRGMAGENWDRFVEFTTARGLSGIEALSKIPGSLGAAPVQNIGAYGQDVAQVLESVEAFNTTTHEIVTIPKSEMNFSYRSSRFNNGRDAGKFIILSVTIKLSKNKTLLAPFYASLQRYIDEHNVTDFSPQSIRQIVSKIRKDKLPDPRFVASSGSFFKNIYLDKSGVDIAEQKGIPLWRNEDGSGKINSGWLIEQCGLKGKELYGFRVSEKAALVLINESATSYAELDKARAEIRQKVLEKFGYELQQEPVEIM